MRRSGILIVSASTGTGHLRAAEALREALARHLAELRQIPVGDLRRLRREKYMAMGEWRNVR